MTDTPNRPPAWAVLEHAIRTKRPVRANYHGHQRLLCPHALGYKHGRPKLLAYQTDGTTSHGPLPTDPRQRWRSMFIDEITDVTITNDPWQTADNYNPNTTGIDHLELTIDP